MSELPSKAERELIFRTAAVNVEVSPQVAVRIVKDLIRQAATSKDFTSEFKIVYHELVESPDPHFAGATGSYTGGCPGTGMCIGSQSEGFYCTDTGAPCLPWNN